MDSLPHLVKIGLRGREVHALLPQSLDVLGKLLVGLL